MLYNFIATAAPQAANTKSVAAFGGFTLLIPVILIGFMIAYQETVIYKC